MVLSITFKARQNSLLQTISPGEREPMSRSRRVTAASAMPMTSNAMSISNLSGTFQLSLTSLGRYSLPHHSVWFSR